MKRLSLMLIVALALSGLPASADEGVCSHPSAEHADKVQKYFQEKPPWSFAPQSIADLAKLKALAASAHKALGAWRCDEQVLDRVQAQGAEYAIMLNEHQLAQWEKSIADEETCRGTDACVAARVCAVLADRDAVAKAIAKEKANPGGVVDLVLLHDLGRQLQDDNAAIPELKAQFQRARAKVFSERMCATAAPSAR